MTIRQSAAEAVATMKRMESLANKGSKEAIAFLRWVEAGVESASGELKDALGDVEDIVTTIIENVDPAIQHITAMLGVPGWLARRVATAFGALEPTQQQAMQIFKAIRQWREAVKGPNRKLLDELEATIPGSIERWIETLPDEPSTDPITPV